MAKGKYPPTESLEQLTRMHGAWRRHDPDTRYGNRPLDDMGTAITALDNFDRKIEDGEARLNALRSDRDAMLADWMGFTRYLKHGGAADARFGEDSVFYEELGFVRSSERKSGLTRKRKPGSDDGTGGGGSTG